MEPILMSSENPTGMKLEDLLKQLLAEVMQKDEKIKDDLCALSIAVQSNNIIIMECLSEALSAQQSSYALLDMVAKDQGAYGDPRIGKKTDEKV